MEPFKNMFSPESSLRIARALRRSWNAFPETVFLRGLEKELDPLELKARMLLLAERINALLPDHTPKALEILTGAVSTGEKDKVGLSGFALWPLTEIVATRGLDHFDESMDALKIMTSRFTAEFAIRPFLLHHEDKTLKRLKAWTRDEDEHVRRLVSEGSRPLLPWGRRIPRFVKDPELTLALIDALKTDPSEYVRRSVANHLNDHAKNHGDWVVKTLGRWRERHPDHDGVEWIARHASRTLLKAGHSGALVLHGYGRATDLEVELGKLTPKKIKMGESLTYTVRITNKSRRPVKALFDYAIHHRKADGRLAPKVFKGRVKELAPGEVWQIEGRHSIKPITTRVYYSGTHLFETRVNGAAGPQARFELEAGKSGRKKPTGRRTPMRR